MKKNTIIIIAVIIVNVLVLSTLGFVVYIYVTTNNKKEDISKEEQYNRTIETRVEELIPADEHFNSGEIKSKNAKCEVYDNDNYGRYMLKCVFDVDISETSDRCSAIVAYMDGIDDAGEDIDIYDWMWENRGKNDLCWNKDRSKGFKCLDDN